MKPNKEKLEKLFSKKEIKEFNSMKDKLPKQVFIFKGEESKESFNKVTPIYFYDEQHDMLYKNMGNGMYKHIA